MSATLNTVDPTAMGRQLMSIALLGIVYRLPDEAGILNAVIDASLEDPTPYRMCRAIANGMTGDGSDARHVLLPYIDDNPNDEAARIAMAIALTLSGDKEGFKALKGLLAISSDQKVRAAVNHMLSFMSPQ